MTPSLLQPVAPTNRVGRYPKHTFNVKSIPFTLQPIMLARVLPAETLKNVYFESRVVTSPVLNPIIGWKKEYYFFYVRVTDLMNDAIRYMFIDPTNSEITHGVESANSTTWYTAKGGVNWMKLCTNRIAETYFRDTDETAAQYSTADGLPIVQIRENTFLDSLTDEDHMPLGDEIADATNMADLENLYNAWEMLRSMGMQNMTYEDWLRSNNIAIPNKDENKPELLARYSEFQYPTNHISTDAATAGAPTSALSWVFKNGNRDPKFFKEPGFVVGFSVTRPKIYFGGLAGAAAGFAKRAYDWMPNYLRGKPETQLKKFGIDTGPLGERTTDADGYFLDMRDELLYGDQFQNHVAFNNAAGSGPNHLLALPSGTDIKWKYPSEAMCRQFFVDSVNGRISQDGYASLSVKGFEVDYTKASIADL